ncbi:MAG TPA: hypothetical protein VGC37_14115 [Friedmanniella sp.]
MRDDAPPETSGRTRPPRRRRLVAVVAAAVVVLTGASLGGPAASAAPPRSPGTFSVSGYDYLTGLPGDVVAGDPDTNLVVTFAARRALVDGTLAVALPTRDWRDVLQVGDRLHPVDPDDPSLRGAVVVRPAVAYDELTDADCRAAQGQTLAVSVTNLASVRTATVSHLTCAPGQSVTVRVFDVQAPRRAGRTALVVAAADASGGSPAVLPVDVRPVPTTRLVVTPTQPVSTLTGEAVTFTVTAVDVRGGRTRVDTRYRGTVNLVPVGTDCFVDQVEPLPATFTAADRGTRTLHLTFSAPFTFRIEAYDVAKRAQPGVSATVDVSPEPDYTPSTCSRSYH